jgi:acetyl-CoA carboxylase biotin carboxyl carrier protein
MNFDNIRALAEIVSAYGLTCLDVSEGGDHIRLEKAAPIQPAEAKPAAAAAPAAMPLASDVGEDEGAGGDSVDFSRLIEVKSPLVGVFYAAPSPDSETFVSIGSQVKKGDVLCIIETMKLLNEITAETDGEVLDICVKDGDVVEYGQTMFKMY